MVYRDLLEDPPRYRSKRSRTFSSEKDPTNLFNLSGSGIGLIMLEKVFLVIGLANGISFANENQLK